MRIHCIYIYIYINFVVYTVELYMYIFIHTYISVGRYSRLFGILSFLPRSPNYLESTVLDAVI